MTKVIDGKFPDYTRVIPTQLPEAFQVDRMQLLQALQRAAILSNEKFRGVRWMLTGNSFADLMHEQRAGRSAGRAGDQLSRRCAGRRIQHHLPAGRAEQRRQREIDCAFGDANSSMLITLPEQRGLPVRRHADADLKRSTRDTR